MLKLLKYFRTLLHEKKKNKHISKIKSSSPDSIQNLHRRIDMLDESILKTQASHYTSVDESKRIKKNFF